VSSARYLETSANPGCKRWRRPGAARQVALESCLVARATLIQEPFA
jgi:hypothetical protein